MADAARWFQTATDRIRPMPCAVRQLVVSSAGESLYYVRSRETLEPERAVF